MNSDMQMKNDAGRQRKVFIKTYGCQMNVYDSQRMADALGERNFVPVDSPDNADLVILNTCHIREKAAEKVFSEVGRLRKLKNSREKDGQGLYIAVAGCVAQAEGAEIVRRAPVVDMVFGPQTYHRLPDMIDQADGQRAKGQMVQVLETDFPAEDKFDHLPRNRSSKGPAAFLTVQEGCDKFCTFCVVPYTRGAEVSRPVAAIIEEAERLVAGGVCEITLLGQNVNAYHGLSENGETASLAKLVQRLSMIDGLKRVRYVTSHPRDMSDDLIAAHGELDVLMPYLHLPVQSGSDRILQVMNRQHTAETYLSVIERMREVRPDIALSGDFIVGFPGETDEDFEDTMSLVRAVGYAQAYSFKYSPRPGTPASVLKDQVDEDVKTKRLAALQALLNEQQMAFNRTSVGKRMQVLMERPGRVSGQLVGRSPYNQAVHVDFAAHDSAEKLDENGAHSYSDYMGRLLDVEIISAGPNSLQGRPVL